MSKSFFIPDWELPDNVHAICTTRLDGYSSAPFDGLNVATHVGDHLADVQRNRNLLKELADLPQTPAWLEQQHTDIAIELTSELSDGVIADASWSTTPNQIATVMTADCLPILLASVDGSTVAAIHAGWKGLADRIITKTLSQLPVPSNTLTAWIGPAISAEHFEVGEDVHNAFTAIDENYSRFFKSKTTQSNKFLADLPAIAEAELNALGVASITKSHLCSYADADLFYSYRREGQTGRMAAMIWKGKT